MSVTAFLTALAEAIANDGLTAFLLIFVIITGARKAWVLGRELERIETLLTDERVGHQAQLADLRSERDRWRTACLLTMGPGRAPPPDRIGIEGDGS